MSKTNDPDMNGRTDSIRLQAYLSKCGIASRRHAEELILAGKVRVNEKVVTELGTRVTDDDVVSCDGRYVIPQQIVHIALNKPKGYVCSNMDPHEELFARDLIMIPEHDSLFHVGRLDKDSTGLIFYTNDGDFAYRVTHPSFLIEKEYLVKTKEKIEPQVLKRALKGVKVDNGQTCKILRYSMQSTRSVHVVLNEGKNREIRRIFKELGYTVCYLHRTRIHTIGIGNLKLGSFRYLSRQEVHAFSAPPKGKVKGGSHDSGD